MIAVSIGGGLGNQFLHYIIPYILAKSLNTELILISSARDENQKFDIYTRRFILDFFNVKFDHLLPNINVLEQKFNIKLEHLDVSNDISKIKKNTFVFKNFEDLYQIKDNSILIGFQSNIYWSDFKKFRPFVKDIFNLNIELPLSYQDIFKQIIASESVFVHVRRGDFADSNNSSDIKYFQYALKKIHQKIKNPKFFVFSDGIPWVRDNFKIFDNIYDYTIVDIEDDNRDIFEFHLMRHTKHSIITTGSTFSKLAAYYSDKYDDSKIIISNYKYIEISIKILKKLKLYDILKYGYINIVKKLNWEK